ncbi:MAG: hypothetical protein ACJAVJ_001124 [Planctomycetota bacterium]|jgi:hypothetical protein
MTALSVTKPRVHLGLIALAYLVLTVAMTWPVVGTIGTAYAGRGYDLCVSLWDIKWVERVLFEGESLLQTDFLFYPDGVSLAYHSTSWSSALFSIPLRAMFGPVVGYNLFFLLQTVGSGVAMFLLVRRIVGRSDAAFLAGFVFCFSPYRLTQASMHPNLGSLMFMPLLLLLFDLALETKHRKWALWTGACLAALLLTGIHIFIMCCSGLVALWLFRVGFGGLKEDGFVKVSLWGAGACVVFCAPFLFQYLGASTEDFGTALAITGSKGQTDLMSFVTPSFHHPLFGDSVRPSYQNFRQSSFWHAYIGFVPMLLGFVGIWTSFKKRRCLPYSVLLVVYFALALGGALQIGGELYEWPMPFDLVSWFPAVQVIRSADRFNLMICLVLPVVLALGYTRIFKRENAWALGGVGLLVAFEYLQVPYMTMDAALAAPRAALLQEEEQGILLEVPLSRQHAKRPMYAQTVHGRKLIGGMVAREPSSAYDYIDASPLLKAFHTYPPPTFRADWMNLAEQWQKLKDEGISHVIYAMPDKQRDLIAWGSFFSANPVVVGANSWGERCALFRIDELIAGAKLPKK